MKRIIYLCFIIFISLIITGCGKYSSIKEINYTDLEKLLKNEETFILEIARDGCENCENFTPKFNKILSEYKISAKMINISNLTNEENTKLENLYNVTGTPTVIFITKGKEESISRRIIGDVDKDKIISKLKIAGLIK